MYKCTNPVAAPTITAPLQQAYGLVHHYLQNTTLAEFAQPSADAAFVSSVYCITNGPYSVSLHASIKSKFATGKDIMPLRRLTPLLPEPRHSELGQWESESLTETSASGVEVRYTFTFLFPAPSGNGGQVGTVAYQNMNQYFNQLKGLIINNTLNGEFDIALDQVYTTNGFPTTYSYPAPNVSGPYYIGPATLAPVVSPPSSTLSALGTAGSGLSGGKLGIIVGVATGVLCVALFILLVFLLYLQRKRQREQEMERWMHSARDANICVMKKPKEEAQFEGYNPGRLSHPLDFFSTTISNVRGTIGLMSRRLSSAFYRGGGDTEGDGGNSQQRHSNEVEPSERGGDEESPRGTFDLGGPSSSPHLAFSTRLRHHEESEL